ncbi:hypothetical protein JOD54_004540 [Actinokineospora baliensis]|uniref:nucleotidyltransferase domain-containing protein n=1 Tax=Actinokineospora baliensis TaxID=547056 RepID=UPI001EF937BB|nr:amino acid transporter [Actinokineospora baliensis]MBM7774336.1 hypothetical protein [Actinokineospora baliensis]
MDPIRMPWEPMTLVEVARVFEGLGVPWWIAGGYAIELAVGGGVREHADIDVVVLRRDQMAVQRVLSGWELWAADPPGTLRVWEPGEVLATTVRVVWCRQGSDQPWRLQVMLDESSGSEWFSRRDPRLRRALDEIVCRSADGIAYLAPEIQLYYKSRDPRPKDETDFAAALPVLTAAQREWLWAALDETHPWRAFLRPGTP